MIHDHWSHQLHLFTFSLYVFKCLLKSHAWEDAYSHWLHLFDLPLLFVIIIASFIFTWFILKSLSLFRTIITMDMMLSFAEWLFPTETTLFGGERKWNSFNDRYYAGQHCDTLEIYFFRENRHIWSLSVLNSPSPQAMAAPHGVHMSFLLFTGRRIRTIFSFCF